MPAEIPMTGSPTSSPLDGPQTDELCRQLADSIDTALEPLRQTLTDLNHGGAADLDDTRTNLGDLEAMLIAVRQHLAITDAARGTTVPASASIATVVQLLVDRISPMLDDHDVALRCEIEPDLATCEGGLIAEFLHTALWRAVNAAAGSSIRQVELAITRRSPHCIRVLVSDSGEAIPIFESTSAELGSTDEASEIRQLAEKANGTCRMINIPFGGGVVLRAEFPLATMQS